MLQKCVVFLFLFQINMISLCAAILRIATDILTLHNTFSYSYSTSQKKNHWIDFPFDFLKLIPNLYEKLKKNWLKILVRVYRHLIKKEQEYRYMNYVSVEIVCFIKDLNGIYDGSVLVD